MFGRLVVLGRLADCGRLAVVRWLSLVQYHLVGKFPHRCLEVLPVQVFIPGLSMVLLHLQHKKVQ